MKAITELREAFRRWPTPGTRPKDSAATLMQLLRDPTPITEAGLRELGFHLARAGKYPIFATTGVVAFIDENGFCDVDTENSSGYFKSMGSLRMLLLSVGE